MQLTLHPPNDSDSDSDAFVDSENEEEGGEEQTLKERTKIRRQMRGKKGVGMKARKTGTVAKQRKEGSLALAKEGKMTGQIVEEVVVIE